MNKKLIAVALAALPAAAMADVTLYGVMAGSVQRDFINGNGGDASQNRVEDNTSLIGFKGTEDLGNGLKTIWQVESRLHLGNGGTTDVTGHDDADLLATREAWLGLDAGNAGKVRIGYINNFQNDNDRVDQWQYSSTYYDPIFGASPAPGKLSSANGLGIFTNPATRLKNAIRYDSATWYGFNFGLMYSFGENKSNIRTTDTGASDIAGVGLSYTYGPVAAHYSYQKEYNPISGLPPLSPSISYNGSQSASRHYLEIDFDQDNWFVGAAYTYATGYDWQDALAGDGALGSASVVSKVKSKQAALSVAYALGAFKPKFTYAKGWDQDFNGSKQSNTGYQQYIFGVDYMLSKRTIAGLSYGYIKFDKNSTLAFNWQSAGGTSSGSDLTLKTLALSLGHSF